MIKIRRKGTIEALNGKMIKKTTARQKTKIVIKIATRKTQQLVLHKWLNSIIHNQQHLNYKTDHRLNNR